MSKRLYLAVAVLCPFLLGCASSGRKTAETALPPEGLLEEEARLREFEFGVGDEIDIFVWRQTDFTRTAVVNPDGYISFALLGKVRAAGRTYGEFYEDLVGRIGEYVREPRIAVNVVKVTDEKIYVVGWVSAPGVYTWNSQMTVVEAIARAGGIRKDVGAPRSIIVASGDPENPEMRVVDYLSILRDGNFRANVNLQRGDVVYVPKQLIAHVDKFFERYGAYIRALREGMWAVQQYPGVEDAIRGDASTRLRKQTDRM